jgi:hypothetical protein
LPNPVQKGNLQKTLFKEFTMNGLKMLIIGFLLGVTIMLLLGANSSSEEANFGFAIPANGSAIVKDTNGAIYVISGNQAIRVGIGVPGVGGAFTCK